MLSISPETRAAAFRQTLCELTRPRNQSDRTTFRKVANWLCEKEKSGQCSEGIYAYVLDFAKEATSPDVKNPAAVFMSILKKELGYPGGKRKR